MFEPDFIWVTRSSGLITPILIEIEKPSKRWFRGDGRPSGDFKDARDQLNDWRSWFTRDGNETIFREKFLFLSDKYEDRPLEPQYVLILRVQRGREGVHRLGRPAGPAAAVYPPFRRVPGRTGHLPAIRGAPARPSPTSQPPRAARTRADGVSGAGCPASSPDLAPLSRSQPLPGCLVQTTSPRSESRARPGVRTPLAGSAGTDDATVLILNDAQHVSAGTRSAFMPGWAGRARFAGLVTAGRGSAGCGDRARRPPPCAHTMRAGLRRRRDRCATRCRPGAP